jgi:hypothetical protein
MFKLGAHLRDEALEAAVYRALKVALGALVELHRSSIDFVLSEGIIDITDLKLTDKGVDLMSQQLAEADLKLSLKHAFITKIHVENFFASDMLDHDFDKAIKMTIDGVVIVLEPQTDEAALQLAAKVAKHKATDEKTKAQEAKKKVKEEKAAAKRKGGNKNAPPEIHTDTLVTSFLQGFESIEISRLHFRLQCPDPETPADTGLSVSIDFGTNGAIKIWEPTKEPKSFRAVDKVNEGVEPPTQDCVKQVHLPIPIVSINPRTKLFSANNKSGASSLAAYGFEPMPEATHVLKEGAGLQLSLFFNSDNLGEDVTIRGLRLLNEMRFCLTKDEVEVALQLASDLYVSETAEELVTPEMVTAVTMLNKLEFTFTQDQLDLGLKQALDGNPELRQQLDLTAFTAHEFNLHIHQSPPHQSTSMRPRKNQSRAPEAPAGAPLNVAEARSAVKVQKNWNKNEQWGPHHEHASGGGGIFGCIGSCFEESTTQPGARSYMMTGCVPAYEPRARNGSNMHAAHAPEHHITLNRYSPSGSATGSPLTSARSLNRAPKSSELTPVTTDDGSFL